MSAKPPADVQRKLDDYVKDKPSGIAVAWVDVDGAAFFSAGKRSLQDPAPITADTEFEIGSVSKVFTALLLAETERAGKVARDEPVAKYLLSSEDPALPGLQKITFMALATHTSGLPRMPSNWKEKNALTPDELTAALKTDGPGAPAGRGHAYSNFGAAVMGNALARAWGQTFPEAIRAHVLAPLGMAHTYIPLPGDAPRPQLAPGHSSGEPAPAIPLDGFAPAGGIISTPRDMALFLQAALGGEAAPLAVAFRETTRRLVPVPEMDGAIGLGWLLTGDPARPIVWHNGQTSGYHTFVGFDPAGRRGVVVFANETSAIESLAFALLGAKPPRTAASPVANAADYVGRYPLNPTFSISVRDEKGVLTAQGSGQPRIRLREIAPDRFTLVGVPAEISFERDQTGAVQALVLHQNGREQRAERGALPPEPKEIALAPELARDYVGDYDLPGGRLFTISVNKGAFFAQLSRQPKIGIHASAKDEFFYKVVDARISFVRDAGGKVTGLVLHQGSEQLDGKKR